MQITVTIKFRNNQKAYDVQLDDKQYIYKSLEILNENMNLGYEVSEILFLRSLINKRIVSVYSTYKDSEIVTGDILEIL